MVISSKLVLIRLSWWRLSKGMRAQWTWLRGSQRALFPATCFYTIVQPRSRHSGWNWAPHNIYGWFWRNCRGRSGFPPIPFTLNNAWRSLQWSWYSWRVILHFCALWQNRAQHVWLCESKGESLFHFLSRPLMTILMPRSLLLKHPQLAANLRLNQGRLTSHYDFYLTIRHLTR